MPLDTASSQSGVAPKTTGILFSKKPAQKSHRAVMWDHGVKGRQ